MTFDLRCLVYSEMQTMCSLRQNLICGESHQKLQQSIKPERLTEGGGRKKIDYFKKRDCAREAEGQKAEGGRDGGGQHGLL